MQVLVWSDEAMTHVAENHLDVPARVERVVKALERKRHEVRVYREIGATGAVWFQVRVPTGFGNFNAEGDGLGFYLAGYKYRHVSRAHWMRVV